MRNPCLTSGWPQLRAGLLVTAMEEGSLMFKKKRKKEIYLLTYAYNGVLAFKKVGLLGYTVISTTLRWPAKADCKVSKETCPTLGRHLTGPSCRHNMVFVASVLNGTAAVEDRGINPSHSPLLGFPTPPS